MEGAVRLPLKHKVKLARQGETLRNTANAARPQTQGRNDRHPLFIALPSPNGKALSNSYTIHSETVDWLNNEAVCNSAWADSYSDSSPS